MKIPTNHRQAEEKLIKAVQDGELQIDNQGRIWRIAKRGWDRWQKKTVRRKCKKVRAEHDTGDYLVVHVMWEKKSVIGQASRLVWRYFKGLIPPGLTINHKDGNKKNNHPNNLEIATYSEQALHARRILGKCDERGEKNHLSKLTNRKVKHIRKARQNGVKLRVLAEKYGTSIQTVSKAALGHTWTHVH